MTPIPDETDTNVYTPEELDLAEVSPTDILAARDRVDGLERREGAVLRGLLDAETREESA